MWHRRVAWGALLLFGLGLGVAEGQTAPDPTDEGIWILRFEHDVPRRVHVDETNASEVWWYVTYRVTNEDSGAHRFRLDLTAETDTGLVYHDVADPLALQAVHRELGLDEDESLETFYDVSMPDDETSVPRRESDFPMTLNWPTIPGGETLDCVAIFQGFDRHMDHLTLRVKGLTNDVQIERTGVPHEREVTERVLLLRYERPGDAYYTSLDSLEFLGREWVTETRTIMTDLR